MATLAQIRSRISRKLLDPNNTGLSASTIDGEINRTIRHLSSKEFWFNDEISSITLVADTQTVPSIPTDIVDPTQINSMLLIDDDTKTNLCRLLPDEFTERDVDQTGAPRYWTYLNGSFLLLPTPDEAYTLKLRYLKKYTDLSGDTDENDFTNNLEDLVVLHTLKNIFAEDKQDTTYAQMYGNLEKIEMDRVEKRIRAYTGAGKLRLDLI